MKNYKYLFLGALLCAFVLCIPAKAQQYQFGFLSYSKVLQSLPEYAEAQKNLQTLKKKYEEEASYNEEKFKRMFADYLQGQKNFPEQIMLKRQKELQIAMEQGIGFRKDAQRLLTQAENEMLAPMQQKLDSVLYLIGRENGLLFIGNSDNHNFPFIHSESGLDITDIVIARLKGEVIPINTVQEVKEKEAEQPVPASENTEETPTQNTTADVPPAA